MESAPNLGEQVEARTEPPTPTHITILHTDAGLLVLDKPAGLPVHPSSRYHHGTVVGRLRQRFGAGYAAPVHRLDRETSGVLLCARERHVARELSKAFAARAVIKEYWALCEGAAPSAPFTVDAPIASGGLRVRIGVRCHSTEGKPAVTVFTSLAAYQCGQKQFCLIRARPQTGRRHQVRVHLREAGLPIVGDKIYGPDENFYERFTENRLDAAAWARLRLPRQALHAACLTLSHPNTGLEITFRAPLAADICAEINGLRRVAMD